MAAVTRLGLTGPMAAHIAVVAGDPPVYGTLGGYQNRGRSRSRLWWLVLALLGAWWA